MKERLHKLRYAFRILFIVAIVAIVIYAILEFVPNIVDLLKSGDEAALQQYLEEEGKRGILVLIALQVLQTITIVFPGIPIYMCAGVVFGNVKGSLICYFTYVITNVFIFVLSRALGEAADELFPNKKEKEMEGLMERTKHPRILVGTLCVLPIIPNGIIPHLAAKSKIDFKGFLISVAIGCIPGIVLFVWCGKLLLDGEYWIIIAMLILAVIGGLIFLFCKKRIMAWVDRKFSKKGEQVLETEA